MKLEQDSQTSIDLWSYSNKRIIAENLTAIQQEKNNIQKLQWCIFPLTYNIAYTLLGH